MDSSVYTYAAQNSSHRGVAMVLALVSAIVLSPLYVEKKTDTRFTTRWDSGFVVPIVLAGLIIAIKTTSLSSSSSNREARVTLISSSGSSWGLAGVLIMLMVVLSWQNYVQHLFWR